MRDAADRDPVPRPATMSGNCRRREGARLVVVLVALAASAFPAIAQQDVSFRGKTVRMIVGSVPGGVTDLGARMMARFIGRYLPQSPTIIVQNMPAANGIAAANYFYQQSAADGLTFLAGSSSQVTPDVIRTNPAVRYDPTQFDFIGGVQNAGSLLIVTKSARERLEQRGGDPVVMAQVGGARTASLMAVLCAEYLGWNLRWVTGYQGTPQVVLALQKGEADMLDTAGVGAIAPLLASGDLVPVLQTGIFAGGALKRRDAFPDAPLLSEAFEERTAGAARRAIDNWLKAVQIGKYFALPPRTPAGVVAAYREAFARMQDDPEFRQQAKTAIDPDYVMMSARETKQLIEDLVATPHEDLEFLNRLRNKYGLPTGDLAGR
jgi:tripartite-type tricarboxylate transporter receptor subunit TctC